MGEAQLVLLAEKSVDTRWERGGEVNGHQVEEGQLVLLAEKSVDTRWDRGVEVSWHQVGEGLRSQSTPRGRGAEKSVGTR